MTIDLKLRSGASLHLAWAKEASDKAKSQPTLNDAFLKASKELPKPTPPAEADYWDPADSKGGESSKDTKGKAKGKPSKGVDFETKLKGLLRLGKK